MLRMHVLKAVFQRNVQSYFSSALGYLIIVVFVVAGAFLAFNPLFFTNNLANLDQLSTYYPMLLLFLIPAITMSTWSEEKKLGTEELLFTLPASDVEILLGKYLASLAVYTAALLFSISHVIVLMVIGEPDIPLTIATYFGYWLAGAALISVGMFASALTNSATIAFVWGTVLCAIPVFIARIAPNNDILQGLSLPDQLTDFTIGLVPLSGILYFVSLTIFFLYLNYILISRRHWSNAAHENMGGHYAIRGVSIGVLLFALLYSNNVAGLLSMQADATSEQIFSLSDTTREMVKKIEEERPVTIQAFISEEVPREYVDARNKLIGLLKQYDKLGGSKIDVRIVNVEIYSDEANEAEILGIQPTSVVTQKEGRRQEVRIYMGVVLTSSYDEVVIPLIGPGTPIEYELTRSLQTVSNAKRLKLGVLTTDAGVMSGGQRWEIISELRQQYEVESISPDMPIETDKIDVLLAVLPSSLTEPQMANLVDYVKSGAPAVILDDPLPVASSSAMGGIANAPRQPKPPEGGGMFGGMQQPAEPKASDGKATSLLEALGLTWQYDEIVWDSFNPHPEFETVVPPEFLFITPKGGNPNAISDESEITSGLQEVLAFFSGTIKPAPNSNLNYTPLLATGESSGLLSWDEFTSPSFNMFARTPSVQIKPNRTYFRDGETHVIACQVTGDDRNVVYVADIDLISDFFFQERRAGNLNFELDNVTFILNAIDRVAGVDDFISLRKRRAKHRTLTYVEKMTSSFTDQLAKEREKANKAADEELANRRKSLEERAEEIRSNTEISDRLKQVRLEQLEQSEQRQMDVETAKIEQEKETRIEKARAESQRNIRSTENTIRYWATFLSPMPALILGVVVVSLRMASERRNIASDRRLK
ncbi:MAG: ABC transporter permease [Planctomyces sp.]|nr:ABC transporter permease [Planctomyces sp.]